MAVVENEQALAIALGASGFCVIICGCVCCWRDSVRRNRPKELPDEFTPRRNDARVAESSPRPELRQNLITGFQAPVRRLDPFSFKKGNRKGNNAQTNFDKVTSSTREEKMDDLHRLYGSLAGQVDADDRAMFTPRTPQSARSTRSKDSLEKAARHLESSSEDAPSRAVAASQKKKKQVPSADSNEQVGRLGTAKIADAGPAKAVAKAEAVNVSPADLHSAGGRKAKPDSAQQHKVPPQLVGKRASSEPASSLQVKMPKDMSNGDSSRLLAQIELPPPPPNQTHVTAAVHPESRTRNDKFDALDAELAAEVEAASVLHAPPPPWMSSMGLPRNRLPEASRKQARSSSTGKDKRGQSRDRRDQSARA
mmetsp:Transcript_37503/g.67854  ORF Transcript_37503/g.67854 Transcript_37503/m.67854 type:complete len:366 (+) Transcript_37503:47-1144(+)